MMAIKLPGIVTIALLGAAGASAAPIPCISATLASYTALSMGCSIGSTVFTGFGAFASVGTAIDPATVAVTPIFAGIDRGFRFDLNQTAGAGETFGILIGYSVTGAGGGSIELNGSSVTPDGVNTGVLNACAGDYDASGPTGCTGAESFGIAFDDGSSSQSLASLDLPTGSFDMFADIVIDGGLSGSASLTSATVLQEVPEPAAWQVMLTGLASFAGIRKVVRK